MSDLPSGTVTMLFTDIEGSTPLVHRLGDGYRTVLDGCRRLQRNAVAESGGHEVDCRAERTVRGLRACPGRDRGRGRCATGGRRNRLARGSVGARADGSAHRYPLARRTCVPGRRRSPRSAYLCGRARRAGPAVAVDPRPGRRSPPVPRPRHLRPGRVTEPERIFQLAAGLRTEFPPLRAERTDGRRLPALRRSRPSRQPTFAEAALLVRELLAGAEESLQPPLADLGGALLTADRALRGADGFLERVDPTQLERRLDAQRRIAIYLARPGSSRRSLG